LTNWLERTELLIGPEAVDQLKKANILLVGLGGVGSYAGEFLVRAGIGSITIVDGDDVDPTNKNRQLQALTSTIGQNKAKLLQARFLDINPDLKLTSIDHFLEPEDVISLLENHQFDFVIDCIDSVLPKVTMLTLARKKKLKVISSMGAGGKLDPSKVKVTDLFKTKECKFAQQVRKEMKRRQITNGIIAVYSEEIQPKEALKYTDGSRYKKSFYGTISYMPALFGLNIAAEVIRRIAKLKP
jgi:tRNA threonylcarbamoyladenosine dehydratase